MMSFRGNVGEISVAFGGKGAFSRCMSEFADEWLRANLPPEIFERIKFPSEKAEIEKGGGTRRFFRANWEGVPAVICVYDDSKAENFLYADLAKFLAALGVPVPRVFFHDAASKILVIEDLGTADLWTLKTQGAPAWKPAYESALASAARLHRDALPALGDLAIMRDGFNAEYYKWERDYFLTNAAKEAHKLCITGMAKAELEYELAGIATHLSALPPQLVHRDFQSQNILWHGGKSHFIDFQGARIGTGWYDVASLLFDPYVELTEVERESLFDFYCGQIGVRSEEKSGAKKHLFYAAAQRLMQACGAYFFLSMKMGKSRYRAFALPALESLKKVATATGTLPNLTMLATELCARERRRSRLGLI